MVDMFFYRDPEEVEKEQQEASTAKAAAAGAVEEAAPSDIREWEVGTGPQAGAINPGLVAAEGGKYSLDLYHEIKSDRFSLTRCARLGAYRACWRHRLVG